MQNYWRTSIVYVHKSKSFHMSMHFNNKIKKNIWGFFKFHFDSIADFFLTANQWILRDKTPFSLGLQVYTGEWLHLLAPGNLNEILEK